MKRHNSLVRNLLRTAYFALILCLVLLAGCGNEPETVRSVVLNGGAYIQVANRQVPGQPTDSTTLAALNDDIFSLEIRATGDTIPDDSQSPVVFMVSNDAGGNEIWVARVEGDSSMIYTFIGTKPAGSYSIPGCNWNDPDVFTHIVLTYDGNVAKVYGNGEYLGSKTLGVDLDIGSSDALIGADWDAANSSLGSFWYGAVDEVRLWTKVLPASEMEFRYRNPDKLTKNYSATGLESLLGLWRFNTRRSDGDTIPDDSGKGNDGVLNSGAGRFDFTDDGAD